MTAAPEPKAIDHQVDLVEEDERQCLTGLRLTVVLGSVTLVSFLVLLDMSILGTVSLHCHQRICVILLTRLGYSANHNRV